MKSITQKDLQSLYQSPSAENTEAIRDMLSNLPDAEETGRTAGFRKYRLAFILAAILLLIIGITVAAVNSNGNGLIWRKTAGSGSIYTLAWEAGDATLNTEGILHTIFQQILLREDGSLYNDILYMSSDDGAEFAPDESAPLNLRNPMPLEAAVVAVCILLAFAAWMILRKRREE